MVLAKERGIGMAGKNIQIPIETFYSLCRIFLLDEADEDDYQAIRNVLSDKLDALVRRETYTVYKTAESPEEREKARRKYLDMVGMRESYRWSEEYEQERKSGVSPW